MSKSQGSLKKHLTFSDDALRKIAGIAASEVEGVRSVNQGKIKGLVERLGRKNLMMGITMEVGRRQTAIDFRVAVEYGRKMPDIYHQVQQKVTAVMFDMTGLEVAELNMYVEDVITEGER